MVLERYCRYLAIQGYGPDAIAVLSEDETAYGNAPTDASVPGGPSSCLNDGGALRLYYPRDISALRTAYQTNSIFSTPAPQQPSDIGRGRLPSDLADPEGIDHDTIKSYAGSQTPASQEAYLLSVVDAMRDQHIKYVVLRSTNPLDELFLAQYLRRAYPDARIVIDGSDRRFEQDRSSTGIGGTMSLSTYPLLENVRDWTARVRPGHREFNSDLSEGTYIAFRLLLRSPALYVKDEDNPKDPGACTFGRDPDKPPKDLAARHLPPLTEGCRTLVPPIPDYGAPWWMVSDGDSSERPATWLSVLGRDGYWPIAALNENTIKKASYAKHPAYDLPVPSSMLWVWLPLLAVFIGFHTWCCGWASCTAKPDFLAHFANPGGRRHTQLVVLGSIFVAMLPLLVGEGCGVFASDMFSRWNFGRWLVGLVVIIEWLVAAACGILNVCRLKQLGGREKKGSPITYAFRASSLATVLFILIFPIALPLFFLKADDEFFVYYRSMNILSGVSPIVPLLALALGMYGWFWYSLHGLALFGADRCRLPKRADLNIPDPEHGNKVLSVLPMFSQEDAAMRIETGATPLTHKSTVLGALIRFWHAWHNLALFVPDRCRLPNKAVLNIPDPEHQNKVLRVLRMMRKGTILRALILLTVGFVGLLVIVYLFQWEIPVRSLAPEYYAIIFLVCLSFSVCLMFVEACQLLKTWRRLRELLTFLDRLPLRRTFAAMHGFSWGSVWGMSGNVLDVRYKLLSLQIECLRHTRAALDALRKIASAEERKCTAAIEETQKSGAAFAVWYAAHYWDPDAGDFGSLTDFQVSAAKTAATLLVYLLLPEWKREIRSLNLGDPKQSNEDKDARHHLPPPSENPLIRNAEEFVCLAYLGFVQNILGRIRTMVMSILLLFVAATVAISSYPFDPREPLAEVMLAIFLALGAVILYVYAQMHRDATLSYVTDTNPGELGADFWLKIASVGIAPLLGLLTTLFPSIADFIFSWLQPSLQLLK